MNLQHYWILPATEQASIRSAVATLETPYSDDCGEDGHVPADPDAKETHCSECGEPLMMLDLIVVER